MFQSFMALKKELGIGEHTKGCSFFILYTISGNPNQFCIDISQYVNTYKFITGKTIFSYLEIELITPFITHTVHYFDAQKQLQALNQNTKFTIAALLNNNGLLNISLIPIDFPFEEVDKIKKEINQLQEKFNSNSNYDKDAKKEVSLLELSRVQSIEQSISTSSSLKYLLNIDIAYLFSSPILNDQGTCEIGFEINLNKHFSKFIKMLEDFNLPLEVLKSHATINKFSDIMNRKPKIIHILCPSFTNFSNNQSYLFFENDDTPGICKLINRDDIYLSLEHYKLNEIELLIVITRHATQFANSFIESGIKCILCINSDYVNDDEAQEFTSQMYKELIQNGRSIKEAYQLGLMSIENKCKACCCMHSHKPSCPMMVSYFKNMKYEDEYTTEASYHGAHTPKCDCQNQEFFNYHNENCEWCQKYESSLGVKFSVVETDGYKHCSACCCSPEIAHNSSLKYLLLRKDNTLNSNSIYANAEKIDKGSVNIYGNHSSVNYHPPYEAKGPQFGRKKEVQQVVKIVVQKQLVNIFGYDGIGRKSVAYRAINYLAERNFYNKGYLYVNMKNTNSTSILINYLSREMGVRKISEQNLKNELKNGRVLMCITNLDEYNAESFEAIINLVRTLLSLSSNIGCIMITEKEIKNPLIKKIYMESFSIEEANKFLIAQPICIFPKAYSDNSDELLKKDILSKIEILNPLTLNELINLIKRNGLEKAKSLIEAKINRVGRNRNDRLNIVIEIAYGSLIKILSKCCDIRILLALSYFNKGLLISNISILGPFAKDDIYLLLNKITCALMDDPLRIIKPLTPNFANFVLSTLKNDHFVWLIERSCFLYSSIIHQILLLKAEKQYESVYDFNTLTEGSIWESLSVHPNLNCTWDMSEEYSTKYIEDIIYILREPLPRLNDFSYYVSVLIQYLTYLFLDKNYAEAIEICEIFFKNSTHYKDQLEIQIIAIELFNVSCIIKEQLSLKIESITDEMSVRLFKCNNKIVEIEKCIKQYDNQLIIQFRLIKILLNFFNEKKNHQQRFNVKQKSYKSLALSNDSSIIPPSSLCQIMELQSENKNTTSYPKIMMVYFMISSEYKMLCYKEKELQLMYEALENTICPVLLSSKRKLKMYCEANIILSNYYLNNANILEATKKQTVAKNYSKDIKSTSLSNNIAAIENKIIQKIMEMSEDLFTYLYSHPIAYIQDEKQMHPNYYRSLSYHSSRLLILNNIYNCTYNMLTANSLVNVLTHGSNVIVINCQYEGNEDTLDLYCVGELNELVVVPIKNIIDNITNQNVFCKILFIASKNAKGLGRYIEKLCSIPHIITLSLSTNCSEKFGKVNEFVIEEIKFKCIEKFFQLLSLEKTVKEAFTECHAAISEDALQYGIIVNDSFMLSDLDSHMDKIRMHKSYNRISYSLIENFSDPNISSPLFYRCIDLHFMCSIFSQQELKVFCLYGDKGVGTSRFSYEFVSLMKSNGKEAFYFDIKKEATSVAFKKYFDNQVAVISKIENMKNKSHKPIIVFDHFNHKDAILIAYIKTLASQLHCSILIVTKDSVAGIGALQLLPFHKKRHSISLLMYYFFKSVKYELLSRKLDRQISSNDRFKLIKGFPPLVIELAEYIIRNGSKGFSSWGIKNMRYFNEAMNYNTMKMKHKEHKIPK